MGQCERVCEHVTGSVVCAVCAVVCVLAVGPSGPSLMLPPWKEDAGRGQMVSSDPLFIIPAKAYSV